MDKQTIKQENEYKRYLNGDNWKCPDAPIDWDLPLQAENGIGAHHWRKFGNGNNREFYCIHCFTIKEFEIDFSLFDPRLFPTVVRKLPRKEQPISTKSRPRGRPRSK